MLRGYGRPFIDEVYIVKAKMVTLSHSLNITLLMPPGNVKSTPQGEVSRTLSTSSLVDDILGGWVTPESSLSSGKEESSNRSPQAIRGHFFRSQTNIFGLV
jgi:hypothetical protein